MSIRAIYDYRGEQFGYLEGDSLFDLEGSRFGELQANRITSNKGELIWYVDRDGIYDMHWVHVGYLGEPKQSDFEID